MSLQEFTQVQNAYTVARKQLKSLQDMGFGNTSDMLVQLVNMDYQYVKQCLMEMLNNQPVEESDGEEEA